MNQHKGQLRLFSHPHRPMVGSESDGLQAGCIANSPERLNGCLDDIRVFGFPGQSSQALDSASILPDAKNPSRPDRGGGLGMVKSSDQFLDVVLFEGQAIHIYPTVGANLDMLGDLTPASGAVSDHQRPFWNYVFHLEGIWLGRFSRAMRFRFKTDQRILGLLAASARWVPLNDPFKSSPALLVQPLGFQDEAE